MLSGYHRKMAARVKQESGDNASILQPGQVIRPVVTDILAKELVFSIYGLKVTRIKEFNSYDDKNFHVQVIIFMKILNA